MQDEDLVQSVNHDLGNFEIRVHWVCEEHVKEVFGITSLFVWLHQGEALGGTEGNRSQGWELGDQLDGGDFSLLRVLDIQVVMEERGKCSNNSTHDGHWMCVTLEALVKVFNLLMDQHLLDNFLFEHLELVLVRQVSIEEQKASLDEGAVLSQLVNGVAAV